MDQIVLDELQCKENNDFKILKYAVFSFLKLSYVIPESVKSHLPPYIYISLDH